MPELPEVETIRRQLAPRLEGCHIKEARIFDPLWCRPEMPDQMARSIRGRRIDRLQRRGKYFIARLSDRDKGQSQSFLLMHLRMTGNLLYRGAGEDTGTHPHLRAQLDLSDGGSLLFVDVRRFGQGLLLKSRELLEKFFNRRLGVEPLGPEFNSDTLAQLLKGRTRPLKALLLDQTRIAGIGNIYADEALFRAGLHPLQPSGTIDEAEVVLLRDAIVGALSAGLEAEGASISSFRHFDGSKGTMQERLLVHSRAGKTCPRCGSKIMKLRAASRGTYICPSCQSLRKRKLH